MEVVIKDEGKRCGFGEIDFAFGAWDLGLRHRMAGFGWVRGLGFLGLGPWMLGFVGFGAEGFRVLGGPTVRRQP